MVSRCETFAPNVNTFCRNNRRKEQQRNAEVTTTRRNNGTMEDRNAPITADLRDINGAA